jgi:hypothetical protein
MTEDEDKKSIDYRRKQQGGNADRESFDSKRKRRADKPKSEPVSTDGIDETMQKAKESDLLARLARAERRIDELSRKGQSKIYPVRKGATPLQFTELFVPSTGTTLTPIASGGRAVASDTDPAAPVSLGQDDRILMEFATPTNIRTLLLAGGAVMDVRYVQTPVHAFQKTFKLNPTVASDWIDITTLDPCTPTGLDINLFNEASIAADGESFFEEQIAVNLSAPNTRTVLIEDADTTTDGTANAVMLMDFGGGGGSLFRIDAKAIGSVEKGEIRIFHDIVGDGSDLLWIATISVVPTQAQNSEEGISERWEGSWVAKDTKNGMLMGINHRIYVATYNADNFIVTGMGATLPP